MGVYVACRPLEGRESMGDICSMWWDFIVARAFCWPRNTNDMFLLLVVVEDPPKNQRQALCC